MKLMTVIVACAWGLGMSVVASAQMGSGGAQLPAGHPDISAMKALGMEASTRPAALGKLAVRVTQGTKDAAAIGAEPVSVDLYHNGQVLRHVDGKLDEHGVLMVEDLLLTMPVQPVVRVQHAGVEYQTVGQEISTVNPEEALELTVYETTEQMPAWQVAMRHLIIHNTPHGLQVTEMLAVKNDGDRTWVGKADGKGGHSTFALPLPEGATQLEVGGALQEGDVRIEEGQLINTAPLMPGTVQYHVSYLLPPKDGKATIALTAPAPVSHMMVFVPVELSGVSVQGLADGGVMKMEGASMRYYKAAEMPAGQQASVTLSGLAVVTSASAAAASHVPQIIAVVGGALVLLVGAAVMVVKAKAGKA